MAEVGKDELKCNKFNYLKAEAGKQKLIANY